MNTQSRFQVIHHLQLKPRNCLISRVDLQTNRQTETIGRSLHACARFQLNMSKYAEENCGKLRYGISFILSSKEAKFTNLSKVTTLELNV